MVSRCHCFWSLGRRSLAHQNDDTDVDFPEDFPLLLRCPIDFVVFPDELKGVVHCMTSLELLYRFFIVFYDGIDVLVWR